MNSTYWITTKMPLLAFLLCPSFPALEQTGWMKTLVLFTWLLWFLALRRVSESKLHVPLLCPPLLSRLLLGWLVKSVSISGREHVCVCAGAPRAHANWGPKGKAFHTDLSQLPCSKHSIAGRVEERSDLHASPLPVCSKYTGKAAASSTNGRQAPTNCRFRSCIGVRRSVTASNSQDSKGTCCPERGAFQASWPLRLSRISLCGGG